MSNLQTSIPLPGNFRLQDFLEFHQRDKQMLAEIVGERSLQKGLFWHEMPSVLRLDFVKSRVDIQLHIDQGRKKTRTDEHLIQLQQLVQHMLGLNQPVQEFEKQFNSHHQLGAIIKQQTGLRVPQSATPFEALSWAITGQQISVHAAISLRRKLILCTGVQHSSGIWCYPGARELANTNEDTLRQNGFSQTKASTLINLAQQVCNGTLPLDTWLNDYWQGGKLDTTAIYTALINLRGIGPWTVNYALLRGFGWLDGSLQGDVAVRNQLQHLLNLEEKPDEKAAMKWLDQFSPWRALIAAHVWKSATSLQY
jgi:DNA-3-methyladenine glycosylase II